MRRIMLGLGSLKIRQKIALALASVAIFTALVQGVSSGRLIGDIFTTQIRYSTRSHLEQMAINLNYKEDELEDYIFTRYYNSNLSGLLRKRLINNSEVYTRKREIESFAFLLAGTRPYIKAVLIQDPWGDVFTYLENSSYAPPDIEAVLRADATIANWGKVSWHADASGLIYCNRAIFDRNDASFVGIISVGIDPHFLRSLYTQALAGQEESIVLLGSDNKPLIWDSESNRDLALTLPLNQFAHGDVRNISYGGVNNLVTTWRLQNSSLTILHINDQQIVRNARQEAFLLVVRTGLLAIAMAIVIGLLLSFELSRNIRMLLQNVRAIVAGDFTGRIQPVNYDEIGMLALEFNTMSERIQQLIDDVAEQKVKQNRAELKSLEAEYAALQAKINPHFLYNTLETINSMAKLDGNHTVSEMVVLLSDLLRESISNKGNLIPLEEEVAHVRKYMRIQQLSYGERLAVSFDIDEALEEVLVPRFILQPLVENAIQHGLQYKQGIGLVTISAYCKGQEMWLQITDNGIGMDTGGNRSPEALPYTKSNSKRNHVGIQSVDKRIRILYGDSYGVIVESELGEGTNIMIHMPLYFDQEEWEHCVLPSNDR